MKRKVIKTLIGTILLGGFVVALNSNVVNKNNINTIHSIKNVQLESEAKAPKPKITIKPKTLKIVSKKIEKKTKSIEQKPMQLSLDNKPEIEYHNFYISFYTSLSNENTDDGTGTDCKGNPLVYGDVADNFLPYGTKIYLKNFGTMTVRDVGSPVYFKNKYTLDVFIPREQGESNQHYYNRVNNMGRLVVKGYILE